MDKNRFLCALFPHKEGPFALVTTKEPLDLVACRKIFEKAKQLTGGHSSVTVELIERPEFPDRQVFGIIAESSMPNNTFEALVKRLFAGYSLRARWHKSPRDLSPQEDRFLIVVVQDFQR